MASIIRIKRSSTAGNPSTLAAGELAYSSLNGAGGNRLYIGMGAETGGNAANHFVIGGTYYTGLIDASTAGTLNTSASSIPILSSTGTIDKWLVGNLQLTGNTVSSTNTNGNISLTPNGTGKVQISGAWTLPSSAGTNNYVLVSDGVGGSSWSAPSASSFNIAANTGTSDTFNTGETLTFTGTAPIATAVSNNTITISATDATTAAKGVASFSSTNFSVTSGAVSIATGGISNTNLANSAVTVNGSSISLGGSATVTANTTNSVTFNNSGSGDASGITFNGGTARTISYNTVGASPTAGSTSLTTVGTITSGTWNGTTIAVANGGTGTTTGSITGTGALTFTAGGTNTNVNLAPNGTGTVDVGSKRITSVAEPTQSTDAATKNYVDSVAQGLHVHGPVAAATTGTLSSLTSGGTVTYANGTLGVGATLTLQNGLTSLDGYTLQNGDRILVKNQATQAHNGIYTWATGGTVLTRATDSDTAAENAGGDFCFVVNGSVYGDTGFVQTEVVTTMGTSNIIYAQFSGAGTYVAGNGLTLTGSTFDVGGTANRISVSSDAIDIASTYVGQTSITTLGTIGTGVWNGTAIGNAYLANSAVTVNGTSISLGASGTITANTTNSLTFNTTGGAAAGTTFNGGTARTIDYSTVGAAPTAGSTSITTLGTIATGTWNGTAIAYNYGGTGFTTYAKGDLIYASAANTLSKLTAATDGQVLQLVSGAPAWGDIDGGTY